MAQDNWDTDSDYRQFNPGMYAVRQLGRSLSRRTKNILGAAGRGSQTPKNEYEAPVSGGSTHPAGNGYLAYKFGEGPAPYRLGPPLPSGIHRRSLSFDNLVILPGSIPRRSTEPPPASPNNPQGTGLPAASTWNSGTTITKAAAAAGAANAEAGVDNTSSLQSANPNASGRRRWLAGLAHPLSTAIDSEYHARHMNNAASNSPLPAQIRFADDVAINNGGTAARGRARYRERESFSGPAQLDASANLTDSQNSVHNSSDPFQNRHMWLGEDYSGEHARPRTSEAYQSHTGAPQSAHIIPSTPISSGIFRKPSTRSRGRRSKEEQSQKVRGIARVIGNISRRLHRIRTGRSASQPATPAEVRQSILDSARQNMICVPNDTGHEFYRFFVNPEEPVSDQDDQPDSPTVSYHPSPQQSRHQRSPTFPSQNFAEFKRSVDAHVKSMAAQSQAQDAEGESPESSEDMLPHVQPIEPVLSNESFERMYEEASRNSEQAMMGSDRASRPHTSPELRRSRSFDSSYEQEQIVAYKNNQGHDGSLSVLAQQKLASEFAKKAHVSTRLVSDATSESSYGTFVRFHPSGELNGIFAAEAKRRSSLSKTVQTADALSSDDEGSGEVVNAPSTSAGPIDINRYARNQESIRRFVDQVRAARQESVRRRRKSDAQKQVLNNSQAVLDAALYVYERQKRFEAAAAVENKQQGNDIPTLTTESTEPSQMQPDVEAKVVLPDNEHKNNKRLDRVIPVRKSEGRRRETVFGIFCGPGQTQSSELSLLEPGRSNVPKSADARLVQHQSKEHRPISHMDKDLPPLPAQNRAEDSQTNTGLLQASIRSTMKRSQSFSHFEATKKQRPRWIVRNDTDMEDRPQHRRRSGFLSGIISKLANGHSRHKSSGTAYASSHSPADRRKLTRRPRNQRAIDDSADNEESDNTAANKESAPLPAAIEVPQKSLEIQVDIVEDSNKQALSSMQRRIYTNAMSSLNNSNDHSADAGGSNPKQLSLDLHGSGSHSLYPSLGLNGSNEDSSRSIGHVKHLQDGSNVATDNDDDHYHHQQPLTPTSRRTDGEKWRDSAVTGLLTQTSAGTPKDPTPAVVAPEPEAAVQHTEEASNDFPNAVRFRERRSIVERTSGVALDTITARDRTEWKSSGENRGALQSMPHSHAASRIVSSNGSFTDMIASASPEFMQRNRMPELPGVEGFSRPASSSGAPRAGGTDMPLPTNDKLRKLENEVLFGRQRPSSDATNTRVRMSGGAVSCDSPISDAGTGRTRILDFAETSVSPSEVGGVKCRRPSARPEMRDIRGIQWNGTNPTSTAVTSAEMDHTAKPTGLGLVDTEAVEASTVLNSLEHAGAINTRGEDKDAQQLESADKKDNSPQQQLALLVQQSPDPRNLIYDVGSQFGSMRSRESHGTGGSSPKATHRPALPAEMKNNNTAAAAPEDRGKVPVSPTGFSTGIGPDIQTPTDAGYAHKYMDEPSPYRRSRYSGADSDLLARASVQATMSESPGIAARKIGQLAKQAAPQGESDEQRESFQEYVERQKQKSGSRSTKTGNEQLNFRVSLLERPPGPNRRARSVSLPSPQPTLLAPVDGPMRQRSRTAHQRTRSFYDSPLLVQTLLLQQSEPSSAGVPPAWPGSARSMSQGADEELEDCALFSTLLGDGAALTPPDVGAARQQSALAPGSIASSPPALPFDPQRDCGDTGVPDSVLRAYMAGDIMAVERFFEHIMHITAPSSIYDGDFSEDGDWSFGLEGPPPEIRAQRAADAAKAASAVESRDLPGMMDASADASRVVGSDTNLKGEVVSHPSAVSTSNISAQPIHDTDALTPSSRPSEQTSVAKLSENHSSSSASSIKEIRKIAVPHSRLARAIPASPPPAQQPDEKPVRPIAPIVALESASDDVVDIPITTVESIVEAPPSTPAEVPCFSPGRVRGRNAHRQQPEPGQRKPLPKETMQTKKQEKRMLMARLRVLETMIQKAAIEESRLEPPSVLQRSRLVEDIQSMESIYTSSMELDYERIHRELSSSVRERFDMNKTPRNVQPHAVQSPLSPESPSAISPKDQARFSNVSRGAEVLKRLKHGSQARAFSPFRANMLERAAVTPEMYSDMATSRQGEQQWSSKIAEPATSASIPDGVPNTSLSEVAYSGRSSGSIRIDIIDDPHRSVPDPAPSDGAASSYRIVRTSNTGRFRRTAKLLAL
ncbi:hypothetical protein LPJ68_000965 [Coemansia sp. RSA 1086]|nr:hypothetical protein LPJ68_000965 [Coemansia sp. RSA 1086]